MTKSPITIVCPGIHDPKLTESFLEQLIAQVEQDGEHKCQSENILIFPTQNYPAYSSVHILQFLRDNLDRNTAGIGRLASSSLVFISFSAGVAGAIGAAYRWQMQGGRVKAFISLDGWGVPLYGNFPIYRLSHDYFTHWSSALLGAGEESFYAEPPVDHLALWRSPQKALGWRIRPSSEGWQPRMPTTAAQFLATLIERHSAFLPPISED